MRKLWFRKETGLGFYGQDWNRRRTVWCLLPGMGAHLWHFQQPLGGSGHIQGLSSERPVCSRPHPYPCPLPPPTPDTAPHSFHCVALVQWRLRALSCFCVGLMAMQPSLGRTEPWARCGLRKSVGCEWVREGKPGFPTCHQGHFVSCRKTWPLPPLALRASGVSLRVPREPFRHYFCLLKPCLGPSPLPLH